MNMLDFYIRKEPKMAELLNLEGLTKETIAEYISDLDDDQLVGL